MRRTAIPLLALPMRTSDEKEMGCHETTARGMAVLASPLLNKGTAFSIEERNALGLTGLLPPAISTLDAQADAAYLQYQRLPDALGKNIYLTALHDCNDVLFFRVLSDHLREMIPIVNDRTVGMAMKQYHHECRRPRGVYLSIDHCDAIETTFGNLGARADDIDLILATDAEQVLGVGDWGVGGIEVSIGKLAIYTAAGGIDPTRVIPVMLDVGTNRESLIKDPMYIGNRHPRVRGERYEAFIDAYVEMATRRFPKALLLWEDFGNGNGRRVLEKYRKRIPTFSDDLQGTGAITLAAVISAMRVCGTRLRNQRVVIFGAGTAGLGIADQIRNAMVAEGLSKAEATRHFWCVDAEGLLTDGMSDRLHDYQTVYARTGDEVKTWKREGAESIISIAEVVRQVHPTMLIGTSGVAGAFTEAIVKEMAAHTDRPIIFPLSVSAEATPAHLIAWTDGRALIVTGSQFAPITYRGITHVIGQANNAKLYPGLCLGAIVARARSISDEMLTAAANAVSSLVVVHQPGAPLLPRIDNLRDVSMTVAVAVAEAAAAEGLAGVELDDVVQQVQDAMWQPEYSRIQAC